MDSQSVKNTDSAEQKGYDAGKKVSGIKRHIAVDTQGLPHAIHVTTANVTDRAGALAMFDQRRDGLSLVQNVLVDGGYTGDPFAAGVQSLLGASVEVVKRNEMHTFVVLPKRWVVERSFAWLEKCRRLWKNCERKLNTSLQMVVLAFAALILKRLQTGSNKAHFPKEDFQIDLTAGACTCPAGQVTHTLRTMGNRTNRLGQTYPAQSFQFDPAVCGVCPLRDQCIASSKGKGRTVTLHPQEALLQQARAFQQSEDFAEYPSRRQVVEHRLARLVQLGVRQSRYFGRTKPKPRWELHFAAMAKVGKV